MHGNLAQEVRRHKHAGQVGARNGQFGAGVSAHSHEGGIVLLQQRHGILDTVVELQFNPLGDDGFNLPLHHLRRQPVVRDTDAHHAPSHRQRLEYRSAVT